MRKQVESSKGNLQSIGVQNILTQMQRINKPDESMLESLRLGPIQLELNYLTERALQDITALNISQNERIIDVTETLACKAIAATNPNNKRAPPLPTQDARGLMSNFNPSLSSNPYVNGTQTHYYSPGNPLCFQCGSPGHKSNEAKCTGPQLSYSEQNYLKAQIQAEIGQLSQT